MVEGVKDVNIRYVIAMTFQLHTNFFIEEHIYRQAFRFIQGSV